MNQTDWEFNDDDAILSFGPTNNGWLMLAAFVVVATYLSVCSEGLNFLEMFTFGTSYHLMLQRMYRELMMVGLASFVFTILSQSNNSAIMSHKFYFAFAFADICCFVMAVFFCTQGIFIMLGSIGQARVWNVAASISSEELSVNVEDSKESLSWKQRYWPFCTTRDQVEFRIMRSIFTSVYGISTKLGDLDFGMFLQATHEANILSIIEISFWKWCLVLFVILLVATLEETYGSDMKCFSTNSTDCDSTDFILIFTIAGFFNFVLAVILFYWGRTSELRLFSSCGVNCIDDYTVFLLTEDRANEIIESNAMGNGVVKQTIAELMAEEKHLKLQADFQAQKSMKMRRVTSFRAAAKKIRLSISVVRRIAKIGSEVLSLPTTARLHLAGSTSFKSGSSKIACSYSGSDLSDLEDVGNNIISPETNLHPPNPYSMPISILTSSKEMDLANFSDALVSIPATQKTEYSAAPVNSTNDINVSRSDVEQFVSLAAESESVRSSSSSDPDETKIGMFSIIEDKVVSPRKSPRAEMPDNGSTKMRNSKVTPECSVSGDAVSSPERNEALHQRRSTRTTLAPGLPLVGERDRRRSGMPLVKKFSSGASFRATIDKIITEGVRYSQRQSTNDVKIVFKSRLKRNFNKQNFKKVFLFGAPELFYSAVSFVITCNSLYLAWWSTHISTLTLDSARDPVLMMLISLLPAILTLPFLALSIRSSSVLRAITYLSMEVVGSVMDKSAANALSLEEFRKGFINVCAKQNAQEPRRAMQRICKEFSTDKVCITRQQFTDMLLSCGMLYPAEKIHFIFSCIDIAGKSVIDMGVRPNSSVTVGVIMLILCTFRTWNRTCSRSKTRIKKISAVHSIKE